MGKCQGFRYFNWDLQVSVIVRIISVKAVDLSKSQSYKINFVLKRMNLSQTLWQAGVPILIGGKSVIWIEVMYPQRIQDWFGILRLTYYIGLDPGFII